MHMRVSLLTLNFILSVLFITLPGITHGQQPITLAWNANSEPNLSHYVLYRDTSPGTMVQQDSIHHIDTTYSDYNVAEGITYYYKLTAVDSAGNESAPSNEVQATAGNITLLEDGGENEIREFELKQNYPNPFNPSTTIEYNVSSGSIVKIIIYDILGQKVRQLVKDYKETGSYRIIWDGKDNFGRALPSGVYLYQMTAEKYVNVKKLVLQK